MEEVRNKMESILTSIKKLLGIQAEYTAFDQDLIIHINTAFAVLNQLNIGPPNGFVIEDDTTTWDEYITSCNLTMVRSYIYMKVRLMFDPPTSGILVESMKSMISELEWRLFLEGDKGGENNE